MSTTTPDEQAAIRRDAQRRLLELRERFEQLRSQADDGECLSELVWLRSEIQACEAALAR